MAQLVTGVSTVLAKISGRKKLSAVCSSSDGLSERSIFPTTVSVEVMESPFFQRLVGYFLTDTSYVYTFAYTAKGGIVVAIPTVEPYPVNR